LREDAVRLERNHYRVLCVAPDASTEEIERSFRQLARRLHPDLNGGDGAAEERMKELNVARAALTDPTARFAYDERLRREQRAKAAPMAPPAPKPAQPQPAPAPRSRFATGPAVGEPLATPWARQREAPAPPVATDELDRFGSVRRVFWLGFASAIGVAIVIGLILLRRALDG
jgi:curved DNA-binding protein CbpA